MKFFIISRKTIYISIILILVLAILLITFWNYSRSVDVFNSDIYYQGSKDEKVVAFACNIDWGNEHIDAMLEIFKANNIKITFFPTGRWAENNKELLLKIYSEGHEIGNHGYRHLDYDKLDYSSNFNEINTAHEIIQDIISESPKYFSPPSGAFNESTIKAAHDLGYKTILWSVDTIDWRKDSYKDVIVKRIVDKVHDSAIVLMHPTGETNKALPDIINKLFQKGYKIGTISDVL